MQNTLWMEAARISARQIIPTINYLLQKLIISNSSPSKARVYGAEKAAGTRLRLHSGSRELSASDFLGMRPNLCLIPAPITALPAGTFPAPIPSPTTHPGKQALRASRLGIK